MSNLLRCLVFGVFLGLANTSMPHPWYESLPAVALDYKVHIDAGKEDCYFQYVHAGATFYVNFQVVRGGDGKAGFAVRNPDGVIVHPYQWLSNSDYQDTVKNAGYYSICIDNQFSRFASKLVNLYITVIRYEEWDKYSREIEELNVSVENFTSTITTVERNINEMLQTQHLSRSREARDLNLLLDNNSYVQTWSIAQIIVIMVTTTIQILQSRHINVTKTCAKVNIAEEVFCIYHGNR
ncbi:Transmembrane emp24 domain-containing protein 6 [Melipona quadrifasciata]|uniref:Transmembrane emp24 domain-containing protein 6 n=1 Tax=Melipona quadrifasciata TaxID=166423 RepID=A0A0M9A9K7_9HYME|nr:Transmembrane emp24 domain-containing protein 6 [Melipona quadrifasciata]